MRYLTQREAQQLDSELLSATSERVGGFALPQLMELAGLSVAEAVYKAYPRINFGRFWYAAGQGITVGTVLWPLATCPIRVYPGRALSQTELEGFGLVTQLHHLGISPFSSLEEGKAFNPDLVVDAIFVIEWFFKKAAYIVAALSIRDKIF
ncbi:hypothetical protein L0F63_003837 [Massospora cicadina]|nr:hypothetical protein L0F63_003837 [Massospora cicadina]